MKPSPRLTCIRWWNSVLVKPGHRDITFTPRDLYSRCAHSLKLLTHAFDAE
jgi:hypothetical protein